jgi:deoxyribodipyrimidine photolyase-related protein
VAGGRVRNLVVVLGDQLDLGSGAFDGFDPARDRAWMAEVPGEARHVWSHKSRIALFLAAMRRFRERLAARGFPCIYRRLGEHGFESLADALAADLDTLQPAALVMAKAGEHRLHAAISNLAAARGIPLDLRPDRHFILDEAGFARWAAGRSLLRNEHLYRFLRQETGILMENGKPLGGAFNFDASNRRSFGRQGPGILPAPLAFPPDGLVKETLRDVAERFPEHPGRLEHFDWPLTPEQAEAALDDFVRNRLPAFGPFQDALWTGQPYLYHSRLAAALNLKLLSPRKAIAAAEEALRDGRAPLESVEGFIRQILGWRELVRGVYWREMPDYLERNALDARQPLPGFFWTGDMEMACLAAVIRQTLDYGYAHHIQRLMVTGLFCLLLGVEPRQVHEWYLAVYVDAVEWVEAPNTLGMSQYADGGLLASKPYAASGQYIKKMSNYCAGCRYDPARATGSNACPFTTLYWDFLDRHRARFARHPRTALQWRSLTRLDGATLAKIRTQAAAWRERLG